jgi:hypothetical protein
MIKRSEKENIAVFVVDMYFSHLKINMTQVAVGLHSMVKA